MTRFRRWLGLERNILVMLGAILVLGMGEELWMRFIPKYLELLGAGAWVIAGYGTLKDLLDAVYQYPGGWLTDRLGRRAALVLFTVLASVGYVIYIVSPNWQGILVGTVFVASWSSLTLPAIFAIIGDSLPQTQRAIGFGVQSILKRIPIILAPPPAAGCGRPTINRSFTSPSWSESSAACFMGVGSIRIEHFCPQNFLKKLRKARV